MLAGRGPYLPEQYRGMWPQVLVENPPKPPSTFRPNLKSVRGLDEFVLRLIAFKPEDRVQSIDQALQGVEGFLRELAAADIAAQVAAPSMPGPVGTRPANLDRTVLLLLVGSLITLAAGGAWIASKAAQMERRGSEVAIPSIPHRPLTPVPAPRVPEPTPTQEPFRQNTQEIAGSPERAYPKEKGGNGGRALRPRLLKHPRRRIEGSLLQASEIDFVRQTREHLHNGEISAAAVTVRMGLRTYPDSDALKQLSRQQRQQRAGR
jgi:serine/threonine protein kinase